MQSLNSNKSFASEKALDATDAVISELKNLARSMLEATNLARNKTRAFSRPCTSNYLHSLETNKESNNSFFESNESKREHAKESNNSEQNGSTIDKSLDNSRPGQCASTVRENFNYGSSAKNVVAPICDDVISSQQKNNSANNRSFTLANSVKALSKDSVHRSCRLPERKYKGNLGNYNNNTINNSISIVDEGIAIQINKNSTKDLEAHSSTSLFYNEKESSNHYFGNNIKNLSELNVAKNIITCEAEETSNQLNFFENNKSLASENNKESCLPLTKEDVMCNVEGLSVYASTPSEKYIKCKEAKMINWFGRISDGVCTFTFRDFHEQVNSANARSERENARAEWYNNILNSLWNAEPHTRFVDIKHLDVVKNNEQMTVSTDKKILLNEFENKADENDVNYCTNSWSTHWCEDDDANCFSTQRKPQYVAAKVFRVPSFPFGGGITWAQLEFLQSKFNEVLQKETNNEQSNENISKLSDEQQRDNKVCIKQKCTRLFPEKTPCLITLKAFSERLVNDVSNSISSDTITTSVCNVSNGNNIYNYKGNTKKNIQSRNYFIINSSKSSFNNLEHFDPTSPYEFVAEIERKIIFDAVSARRERLELFRREVQEKNLPAIPDTFNLRIIMDPLRTGFQEDKTFPIIKGDIIANRYQVIELLGKATFSRTVRCYDLQKPIYDDLNVNIENNSITEEDQNENCDYSNTDSIEFSREEQQHLLPSEEYEQSTLNFQNIHGTSAIESYEKNIVEQEKDCALSSDDKIITPGEELLHHDRGVCKERKVREPIGYVEVCLKIINNSKDFFDQSLDEIRLLRFINAHKDADDVHVIRLIDAFYYKEHTMLVTELLSDNLYEYSKYNRENESEPYFTLEHLRSIARQITESLAYIHSLKLIHADLKPENILFVSHRRCIVKIIDFGSSCFLSDHLSSYIQSRSYRAPEVILGCDYDGRIDVWSLGAILVELVTGEVLFPSKTVPDMLARIVHVCGSPLPRSML